MSDALKAALKIVQELQELREVQSEILDVHPRAGMDVPLWAEAQERIDALQVELEGLL